MKKDIKKSYKKGDKNLCPPTVAQPQKDEYCNKNFVTDPEENEDCNYYFIFRQRSRIILHDLLR